MITIRGADCACSSRALLSRRLLALWWAFPHRTATLPRISAASDSCCAGCSVYVIVSETDTMYRMYQDVSTCIECVSTVYRYWLEPINDTVLDTYTLLDTHTRYSLGYSRVSGVLRYEYDTLPIQGLIHIDDEVAPWDVDTGSIHLRY